MYTIPNGELIPYKDVYFLWKSFLRENYLPYVVTQHKFKSTISQLGTVSMKLTTSQIAVLNIKHFWDKYIVYDDDTSYDVHELVDIYNQYEKIPILYETMQSFLSVEYPQLIDSNVPNVKCVLWDKELEIDNAMDVFKQHVNFSNNIDDMYAFYQEYTQIHHRKCVNKSYFEKHIIL